MKSWHLHGQHLTNRKSVNIFRFITSQGRSNPGGGGGLLQPSQ